ncbi:MAG: hypothetical protein J0L85_11960, partial [Zoogloea sp.]|nr:hypothetical protein [Zoogloea sp.]
MAESNPFLNPDYGSDLGKPAEKNPFLDPNYGKETDGPLTRGWTKTKQNLSISADLAAGNTESAAKTIKASADYTKANPGPKEGTELMEAWKRGDGVTGGVSEVLGEIGKDYREAKGFIPGLVSVGKNLNAMGQGILEQAPNMVAPLAGMAAGGFAGTKSGTAVGGAVGAAVGGVGAAPGAAIGGMAGGLIGAWGGASAGNAALEGGGMAQEGVSKAGINPDDAAAVKAYLDENRDALLKQASIKGGIIGAVDTATMGIAGRLLNGPARAAAGRALVEMGIDTTDRAAAKAAMNTPDFAQRIAADAAYQASRTGAERIARNAAAAALDPAGEFAGEYLGQGIATGDWDAKGAALEALSSLGQSTATFAGQKAYQAVTRPATTATQQQPSTAETPPPAAAPAPAPVLDEQALERAGVMPPPVLDDQQISRKVDLESGAPIPYTPPPAEELAAMRKAAMGIDPATGPLSAGAAIAIETQAAEDVRLGAASTLADGATSAEQARAAQEARRAADPGMTFERTGQDASVASGQQAIWRNRDFDLPIEVVDVMSQPGPDGRRYAMVRGAINDREAVSYVPLDEIVPSSPPAASKTTPTPSPQAAPTGSFGAMNDFADLLGQERQDVAQRRAGIAERQGLRREFDLA